MDWEYPRSTPKVTQEDIEQAQLREKAQSNRGRDNYLKDIITRYKGIYIGINYDDPTAIKKARIVDAQENYFSVTDGKTPVTYNFPYDWIISIAESDQGSYLTKFYSPLVVYVYHLVVYKGAIGFVISF